MTPVSAGVATRPPWTDPDGFGGRVAAAFVVGHGDLLDGGTLKAG
ncbi:hypothetical protein [Streptomyces sp. NPDC096339]